MLTVTPCRFSDLPQTQLEPILLRYAALHGFPVRFSTELLDFKVNDDNTIIVNVYDRISTQNYHIKTRYLYGADGSHSRVAKLLHLPFSTKPRYDKAVNVLFKADLRGKMDNRLGDLHLLMNPAADLKDHAWSMMLRMVKPWHEWLGVC
jgi:2-polyprenyl-6-methoxyphenol hydroxylase-like FAD-dependent oxidoreductase